MHAVDSVTQASPGCVRRPHGRGLPPPRRWPGRRSRWTPPAPAVGPVAASEREGRSGSDPPPARRPTAPPGPRLGHSNHAGRRTPSRIPRRRERDLTVGSATTCTPSITSSWLLRARRPGPPDSDHRTRSVRCGTQKGNRVPHQQGGRSARPYRLPTEVVTSRPSQKVFGM